MPGKSPFIQLITWQPPTGLHHAKTDSLLRCRRCRAFGRHHSCARSFVFQNLRGRFKSEGVFKLSQAANLKDPKDTSETTDAYDTIDWLVKHVPNNNGKVGIWGVSYVGLTAGMTLLQPHPALKAVSEQASPVDQWMNDDDHRFGALRESYTFEYAVLEQADKNKNTHFQFDSYDTYEWYLKLGPLANINKQYVHGQLAYWNSVVEHPNYDDFWRR